MALRVAVNKKTGAEYKTINPELLVKRYPRVFTLKPVQELEQSILNDEKKSVLSITPEKIKKMKRASLNDIAHILGIDYEQYTTKKELQDELLTKIQ